MIIRSWFATAAMLAFAASSASAEKSDLNIQALYEICRTRDSPKFGLCLGYVSGIADMMLAFGAYSQKTRDESFIAFSICGNPSYGSMVQAFVNWAKANPQRWSEERIHGVTEALRDNWPGR